MLWSIRWPGHGLSLWALLLGLLSTEGQWAGSGAGEYLDTARVAAVTGGDAKLPCNTLSPHPADALLLVVWYKDDVPVYSFDGRKKGPAANWADDMLAGRTEWHAAPPSTLLIRNIVPEDRALYRCRVDFKISPTINQKILLDIIELPAKPKIFDELDKEMIRFAGPYVEDTSTKLTCVVSGGNPTPRIRWWRDDKVLSTLTPAEDGSRISLLDLRIPKLTREYNEAIYSCTADNTALVPPLRTNVQIQMYLRPLSVEILTREQPLSVQQTADVACRAVGARPPALITWWLDNEKLSSAAQKDSENQNETLSILRWTPNMKNNGQTLTCRASHSVLKHATIDTSLLLNLHYVPIVVLKLGSELNPADIEEGDDVYFVCVVQAYPPAYKVVWEHNGQVITHNQRAGVIAAAGHLAIQAASREQAGNYSCTASNVEGDGSSQPFPLKIIYKPVCKVSSIAVVGVAINEEAKITCEVDAFPRPESFQWTLNNSMGTVEFDSDNITIVDGKSILSFTPRSETDYGVLSCKASNTGGQQAEPCRFAVHRPYNCSTVNMTDDSVELQCVVGYDGGLHTSYCVEAWEAGNLVLNVSTATPIWKLRGLGSGKTLKLVFYAHSARGRTKITTLRVHTLSRLALHTGNMPFKIVSTRRQGKVELCTVPETWEVKGILRWPKMYGDILSKNDSTQPQTDWLTYNCVVKRRNYSTYEEAEDELSKMLDKTDTDDTDDGERSYKRTTPTQKVLNLNAAAQRIMIKPGNPNKRMKQPTSTTQAGPTIPTSQAIQAGPITQAGPTIPASQTIQARPFTQAGPTIQASQTIQAGPTIQARPFTQASPITQTGPTIQASPFTQADPTIQIFPETSIQTNQQPSYIIDETFYTVSTGEQENTPQEVHYYTNDQNMTNQINNLYEIQTAILDNQNKIMKKLGEMSVQLQEIQEQSTENITVTTLAQAKGAETKRMCMEVVDNIESLEKLDKELSCPKILQTYLEKYAILCSVAPGSGSNCAYRLLDSIFTKDFLCQCSWTGGSRGDDLKIGFKKYKNVLKFFFQMVYYWDNTYTVQDNEEFFKNILRNALKRKTSKNIRQSSKKRRKFDKRVQRKPQNQRSAANNHDDEDVMNNHDEGNTNNDSENNTNNDGEVNINDNDGNDNPNDENTNNNGINNKKNDEENNPSNENEAIIEENE